MQAVGFCIYSKQGFGIEFVCEGAELGSAGDEVRSKEGGRRHERYYSAS
jgi:hypothetical protein